MRYPLTVRDFLDRAEHVYPDRVGVVDEPDQPAPGLGELTYRQMGELAAAQAAKLDQLGVPTGGRVAFVSQNSARLLTSFFGVCGYGRVLVPINFRLSLAEIRYIVEHSGADVVYVDPEQKTDARRGSTSSTSSCSARTTTLYLPDTEPRPWDEPDEDATATINYTSGTTARPKGVQLTHRNNWLNATVFGLHTHDQRPRRLPAHAADVPRQRLGHAVRHHRRRARSTSCCARSTAPRSCAGSSGTASRSCAPRPRSSRPPSTARRPGTARSPAATASASSPPARRRRPAPSSGCSTSWAGSSSRSTASPRPRRCVTDQPQRAEWDDLTHARAGQAARPRRCAGAGRARHDRRRRRGADRSPTTTSRATGSSRTPPPRRSRATGSTPATAASSTTTATSSSPTARRTSSSPAARTSPRSRSRTR